MFVNKTFGPMQVNGVTKNGKITMSTVVMIRNFTSHFLFLEVVIKMNHEPNYDNCST